MFFFILVSLICLLFYLYGTRNYAYWSSRGVKHDSPIPFFGNNFSNYSLRKSFSNFMADMYKKYPDEPYVGFYNAYTPHLILKDPALIRDIFEKDFSNFYPRIFAPNTHDQIEPLLNNIFFNYGNPWKLMRQEMTSAFTTGKLKAMFRIMRKKSENLKNVALTCAKEGHVVDLKELFTRFTIDFIAASNLSLEVDTLKDEQAELIALGKRMFTRSVRQTITFIFQTLCPQLAKGWPVMNPSVERDVVSLVRGIMEQRNYKPSGRNDMMDLLLELRGKGKMVGNSIENRNPDGNPQVTELEFTDELIASHIMLFFGAGSETAASIASFALNQLAYHPEAQAKCQEEIDRVLKKYDGLLCYESVKEMKYLEMAYFESLRMFPPIGYLLRKCVKNYTLPGTNITLDEGVAVTVSIQGMQNDEKYFENPTKFMPERFTLDRIKDIPKHVYLPFGTGPRKCIGERLAYMQVMTALISVLQACSAVPVKSSVPSPELDPGSVLLQAFKRGIPLLMVPRTS